jgi:hypothetical protein
MKFSEGFDKVMQIEPRMEMIIKSYESSASLIMKKLETFKQHLPLELVAEAEWCINEIKAGDIYTSKRQKALMDELREHAPLSAQMIDEYSELPSMKQRFEDDHINHTLIQQRQSGGGKTSDDRVPIDSAHLLEDLDSMSFNIFELESAYGKE